MFRKSVETLSGDEAIIKGLAKDLNKAKAIQLNLKALVASVERFDKAIETTDKTDSKRLTLLKEMKETSLAELFDTIEQLWAWQGITNKKG